MKTNKLLLVTLFFAIALNACKKDKHPVNQTTVPPDISGLEIGIQNNKMAYPGNDLHLQAVIKASEGIDNIRLEISPLNGNGWKFTNSYVEGFAGTKNADFHKHIKVPADAAVGNYKVVLTVTDKVGKTAKVESELKIVVDTTLPSVTGLMVEYEKEDNEIHLEANIAAPNKIAKIGVKIKQGDVNIKEVEYTDPDMVGTTSYKLHKHISLVGIAAGHYHVYLKVIDQNGKFIEVENHFDKK